MAAGVDERDEPNRAEREMTESIVKVASGPIWEAPLYQLLMLMHSESGMAPVSAQRALATIRHGLMRHRSVIGVIGTPDRLEGTIGLYAGQLWYTEDYHLEDVWNFVHPDHRRSDHAKALLAFATKVSDQMGTPVLLGILSTKRTEAKVRLYERRLAHSAYGATFFYRPGDSARVAEAA